MFALIPIIRKEFIQFRRDKRMFVTSFITPVMQLLLLGFAATLDVKEVTVGVCDQDHSPASRALLDRFAHNPNFRLVAQVDGAGDGAGFLDAGTARVALVIPPDFGQDLAAGRTAQVQALVDGSNANTANISLNYTAQLVGGYGRSVMLERQQRLGLQTLPMVVPEVRVWYNPELRSRWFMVPGVLAMLLMIITMVFTSLAIVREKEIGTLEQLNVTPLRPWQLVLGKLTPFTLIGLIDVGLVTAVAVFGFGIPLRGSLLVLYVLAGLFLLSSLGLGLLVSTFARTQQQAMMGSMFFVILPMMFLSGFIFPIENMPEPVQVITYAMPLRYFFVIIRGLFLKGVGWAELWDEAAALLLIGLVILALSILRFRKTAG